MKRILPIVVAIVAAMLVVACGTPPAKPANHEITETLVQYVKVSNLAATDARAAISALGIADSITQTITHDVAIYHITYNSTYRGDSVVLSGFVAMPATIAPNDSLRHIQYNHGMLTPIKNVHGMGINDTPSRYSGRTSIKDSTTKSLEARLFGIGLAGNGFMVSIPDYAGYGESEKLDHPFLQTAELQIEATDMVRAARELARIEKVALQKGVYLSGWSEGGAVALAQHRYMEANTDSIPVRATSALAGLYIPSRWADLKMVKAPLVMSWMLYSHLSGSADSTIKSTDIWIKPTSSQRNAVDKALNKSMVELFAPSFIRSPRAIVQKLLSPSDNHTGWTPRAPIYLHHGERDNMVEYAQSTETFASLKKEGADSIFLVTYPQADHFSALETYFMFVRNTFNK